VSDKPAELEKGLSVLRIAQIDSLVTRPPFNSLFPIKSEVLEAIQENMQLHGFDRSKPIDVWIDESGEDVVIDGHTRLSASEFIGMIEVPVFTHEFADEDEALLHAIANQRNRRNLRESDILRLVELLDKRRKRGGDRKSQQAKSKSSSEPIDRRSPVESAKATAKVVGTSPTKVKKARKIIDKAKHDPSVKDKVIAGGKTISSVAREIKEQENHQGEMAPSRNGAGTAVAAAVDPEAPGLVLISEPARPYPPAKFNRTNDMVEWALWTWNPVTGCKHDCIYCYARDIAIRHYPEKFEPTFHPERLNAPRHMKVPDAATRNIGEKNVFVCSMADLFGRWVPDAWIDAVMEEVRNAPRWNFLFLTKFPLRYEGIDFPDNAWVGTTVDEQKRVTNAEKAFRKVKARVKWLSCEPLREDLVFSSLDMFDWVVMGGQSVSTQAPAFQPPWAWVEHLWDQARAAGCQVYWKPNLETRPREYPGHEGGDRS
jgi:protein gp37